MPTFLRPLIFVMFSLCLIPAYAANQPPLIIATDIFSPPFVMRGANNQLFGYDIELMRDLCTLMQRTCDYKQMPFNQLLDALVTHKADLAVSSITITLERSKKVAFSLPYLLSYAQYAGLNKWGKVPFSPGLLAKKSIGIEQGSVFKKALTTDHPDAYITEYPSHQTLIQALQNGSIDFALMDAFTADYWQTQSNNVIITLGKPFTYGYGFGIAVNPNEPALLKDLNEALLKYQNNGEFQKDYNIYLRVF